MPEPTRNGRRHRLEGPPSAEDTAAERVQKFLSRAGVASRRAAEDLVASGRVQVNGETVDTPGVKIVPGLDEVRVDGVRVSLPDELWYVLLNKPAGVVTTLSDPQGRATVARYVPDGAPRLFPVGRLDAATTGLLILTNDGDLAHLLMHPRHHVPKVYRAEVDGVPTQDDLRRLREGVALDDGYTASAGARLIATGQAHATVELILREGRKRQVRRMLSAVGHPVRSLTRVAYGPLTLGSLAEGATRRLSPAEVRALRASASGGGC